MMHIKNLLLLVCIAVFMAFTSKEQKFFLGLNTAKFNDSAKCDSLFNYGKQYIGKPYCYGSRPPSCFDCSGFVMHCFSHFGKQLPHSSASLGFMGKFVSFQNARKGDLVFFTGRNSNSESIGHVGIVEKYENNKIYFIHASVHSGVTISYTQEEYYAKRLLFLKRVVF